MLNRCTVLAMLILAMTVSAQDLYMNCHINDEGEIWLNGARYAPLKYTAYDKRDKDSSVVIVPVRQGTNALAIRCVNTGWTGGVCASLDLTEAGRYDTLRSDSTWKCMGHRPGMYGSDISTESYDVSGWMQAGDYGFLADDTGGYAKLFFSRNGLEAANLFFQKARWVWTPKTVFVRKAFTPTQGAGQILIRGNGFTHRVFLNGELVGQSATVFATTAEATAYNVTLNPGAENVVAFEATCLDSINFAFVKCGVFWGIGTTQRVLSDSTWRHSWTKASGWNDTGFVDDGWLHIQHMAAYDAQSDALNTPRCEFIWPVDMWFHTTFTTDQVGTLRIARPVRANASPSADTEYFTLLGRRVSGHNLSRVNANAVLIRRAKASGSGEVGRVLRLVK